MDDQELKRLKRFLYVSWFLLLLVVAGAMVFASLKYGQIRDDLILVSKSEGPQGPIGESGTTGQVGRDGLSIVGPPGPEGPAGAAGVDGADGATIEGPTGSEGAQGPQGEPGPQGEQGPPGEQGPQGRTVFYRQNLITGAEECRFAGDEDWQPIEECE